MWGHRPRGTGGGGERGGRGALRGPPRCPNFLEPSGLNPRRRQSPAFSHGGDQRGGTVAPDGRAGAAVRDQGAGTAPPGPILTTRRGRAAQPERQQRPQPRGVQGGHLLGRLLRRRRRLGRSTWRGGPNRGAPTFCAPPPAPVAPGLALAPKLRLDASTPRTPSQPCPGRRLSRRPKFGSNFLECAVSCVLPPRPPPPTANPAPCRPGRAAACGAQGFPAGRSAGRAARGGIYYESSASAAGPARVESRRALTPSALERLAGPGLCQQGWVLGR